MNLPPPIVIEDRAMCGDAAAAEASVRESMRATVAPEGWTVRVTSTSATHVVGVLEDEAHRPVAHRDMEIRSAKECGGTMHALGVWASLVLDEEVQRASDRAAAEAAKAAAAAQNAKASMGVVMAQPEADAGPVKANPMHVELGLSTLMATGIGATPPASATGAAATNAHGAPAFLGASVFVVATAGRNVYMRPSVSYARALGNDTVVDWGSTRFDVCARVPGNYQERKGLQIEACLGPEAGLMSTLGSDNVGHLRPLFGFGPTVSLRGEFSRALAIELRASTAYNIVHGEDQDNLAPLSVRAELGMTWGAL